MSKNDDDKDVVEVGSWVPTFCITLLAILWWVSFSQSLKAIRLRRWFAMKKVKLKKDLGLRDETIYRDGKAGDGANQKHKRQG